MTSSPAAQEARGTRTASARAAAGTPTPCCTGTGLKRGPWTPEEDKVLAGFIRREGEGKWRTLPRRAGLLRCGKSCRLRWMNYLKPSVKRGRITPDEEDLILRLHRLLGNRWSLIAGRIPGRTDNEIKNYWNTHLSKKLISNGIDPTTHKPLNPRHRLYYRTANPKPSSDDPNPNCTLEPHRKPAEEPAAGGAAAAEESGGHAGAAAVPPMMGSVEEAGRLEFLPEDQYYFSSLLDSFVVDGDELLRGMGDGYCRSYYASSSDGLGEYESIGSLWDVGDGSINQSEFMGSNGNKEDIK